MTQKTWTSQLILKGVIEILEDALGVDADEATLDATLVHHLGAESIDFLDIFFRSEKAFDIKISRTTDFPNTGNEHLEDPLEPEIIEIIVKLMPFVNPLEIPEGASFADICTVQFYCQFIAQKLGVEWITPAVK